MASVGPGLEIPATHNAPLLLRYIYVHYLYYWHEGQDGPLGDVAKTHCHSKIEDSLIHFIIQLIQVINCCMCVCV